MTISDVSTAVSAKALAYVTETGETMTTFPQSMVDFVVEYATNMCHFPASYTEAQKAEILNAATTSLAMACVEVYSKIAGEGQLSHSENGVARVYDASWISPKLINGLPNFANAIYGE